ncbi:MAG: hypothetical protein U9O94_10975 [Nanoarchaeota archaeon]|nr:hypothetical protein [Nanoarchaeota archaeon]
MTNLTRIKIYLKSILDVLSGAGGAFTVVEDVNSSSILAEVQGLADPTDDQYSLARFDYDGTITTVMEDIGTPANSRPLPVKLTGATGDINITAGDLNVQLSHSAVNYDSTRIGDGTDLLAINADGSINVSSSSTVSSIGHISNTNVSNVAATQIDGTSNTCSKCIITASENNTGLIRIGSSALTTTTGVVLYAGESIEFEISDTNLLYAIASVNGEDVSVTYFN